MAKFDERGFEIPDQTRVEVPLGYTAPLTMEQRLRKYVREELSRQADDGGMETFEEADDFEVDDDGEIATPYELTEMQEEPGYGQDAAPPPPPGKKRSKAVSEPQEAIQENPGDDPGKKPE